MKHPLLSLVFLVVLAPAAHGQEAASVPGAPPSRRTLAALRLAPGERIALDGILDEAAWRRAVPATDFIQQDPDNGQPATEQTEVFVVFDEDALYMGVVCHDSEPDKWLGYQRRRDEFLQADDRFMWNIDTYNNQQSGYFFEMNPSGLMGDALRGANFQNRQWDGIWNAKVRHSEIGWTLEIEIPFRTLNFDPEAEAWGINFQRTVRRKNEESLWMGWGRNQGLNRLSNAGLLTGLTDIEVGHGLDLKPYVVATSESFPGRGVAGAQNDANAGVDLFFSPTPKMRTNLTVNTDFAQTEVDQRLTNLTRFPQFFPEKRDFFLDGSTFFDFQSTAQGGNSLMPFFSRRIGLDENGNPQKIDVGGKLAGQFGANDVGAMYVRTGVDAHTGLDGASQTIPGEDFAVVRAKHRMFRQSYVGMMYTGRNTRGAGGSGTRNTVGGDFLLATSSFRGGEQLSVGGFFVNTSNPAETGKSSAYGVAVEYPNDPWSASFFFREIQENYNAAVGFTPRRGFRRMAPSLQYTQRPRGHRWIRSIRYGADADFILDARDNLGMLNREISITAFDVSTHAGDSVSFDIEPTYEKLESDFTISQGIRLPKGSEYTYTRYRLSANTAQRRVVAFGPTVEAGGFYNGTRRRFAMSFNVRLRPGVIIYTSGEWNSVDLDQGSFTTRLYRIVPELQFSPWIAWVNNIQYDTQSRLLGWQSRFRWILRPGNDFYLVYTHNWLDDPLQNRLYTLDRRAATKFLYTQRF
ncbi:MAG: carbohydrate binding family 9 domain-containing protein [Acidobacteria bacterium]|nr:carbohydrate binding family 9 domain-containing protein [Acidobacteriota bacterium]